MSQDAMTREQLEGRTREIFEAFADVDARGMRDLDAMLRFFADDLAYSAPFMAKPPVLNSVADFKAFLGMTQGVFTGTVYTFHRFTIDVETQTVVVECSSARKAVATGDSIAIRYVFFFTFRDGQVAEMREYTFSTDQAKLANALKLD